MRLLMIAAGLASAVLLSAPRLGLAASALERRCDKFS
jgi:hypothetical protein